MNFLLNNKFEFPIDDEQPEIFAIIDGVEKEASKKLNNAAKLVEEKPNKESKETQTYSFTFKRDGGHGDIEQCTVVATSDKQARWKAKNLSQLPNNKISIWDDRVILCDPIPVKIKSQKKNINENSAFQEYKNSSYYKHYQG